MFVPPRCPSLLCPAHAKPTAYLETGGFFCRNGRYQPKCRAHAVPRFKCKVCGCNFSRQTFRMDYGDNKPHLNAMLFKLLASGLGLRQSARVLGLSRRCTELKARKLSRHLGRLTRNLTGQFAEGSVFGLDEMETFETERAVLPVTVPILIETRSMFVIATDVAPIRPSGKLNAARRAAIAKAETRYGRRPNWSRQAVERTFKRLAAHTKHVDTIEFVSDKKHLYGQLLAKWFTNRGKQVVHRLVSSRRKRDQTNPLRHSNLTNAMARDLVGRLRRESWLVSKRRRFLRLQLYVFAAYRNFVRRRINRETPTPAEALGFSKRALTFEELLTWRQDWKGRSIHPIALRTESVAELRRAA